MGNVPHLRFPEFSGEWKKCKLGDLCNVLMCKRILVSQTNTEDGVPFYKIGTIGSTPDAYISKELFDDYKVKYNYPRKGEVMITCAGTVGKCVVYDGEDAYFQDSNIVWIDNPTQYISNGFLFHLLSKVDWRKLNSTTIIRIYNDDLRNLKMSYPRKEEQQKISHLLSLLDERIATQNKIIEKLQSLIKGLRVCCMQRNGSNNVYLSEIAQIYQPQTISSAELTEDGFLVYGANGIIGKYKDYNHKTEQICITCRGNTCGMVNYTKPMSWITGNAMVINTDKYQDKVYKKYLYHYLSAYNFNSIISGSGQPQIVRTPLEKLKITLPTISEQKQKAMILDKIQDKIEINHNILNLYILQKQYLLRQMFI
ncbi:restriction endonuclease subunit S, partial [Alistipes putredinis]|uniref:restriction endonuclease subunit S n=1 Tax=Alistipes putredinis TaxID=28117 RepID=UPI003AB8D7A8